MNTNRLKRNLLRIAMDHQVLDPLGFIEEMNEAFELEKQQQVIWGPDQPVDEWSTQ